MSWQVKVYDAVQFFLGGTKKVEFKLNTSGNVEIKDVSGNIIATIDAANRKLTFAGAAQLDSPSIQYAVVEITAAQILALYTTPKSLVAAPGAGNVLDFVSLQLAYDAGATAYTIGTAGNLQVKYTDGAGAAASVTQAVTGMIDQTTDQIRLLDKLEASTTPVANAALVLTLATANPTSGNGTVHAKVIYRVYATGL